MTIKDFKQRLIEEGSSFKCDKFTYHHYEKAYATHFYEFADSEFKLLEIGVGGEDKELGGASIKVWEAIFPNAKIYGLDIYDKSFLDSERVKTFIVDQSDQAALQEFSKEYGPFDIIIDDGSHKRADVLASLFALIGHVKPGGYYVIEDYFTSYWPVYDGSSLAKDFIDTPVRWLKNTIDVINLENLLSPEAKSNIPSWPVESLHVYPGVAFMQVGDKAPSTEIPSNDFSENQIELDSLRYGNYEELFSIYRKNPMDLIDILKELRKEK